MPMFFMLAEAVILASTCSIDAFTASFAYGIERVRIPLLSNGVINLICSSILGVSLWAGSIVRPYLPDWLTIAVCFSILFLLGISKLLQGMSKTKLTADVDDDKIISPAEAVTLAVSLSLDGIGVGFGMALRNIHIPTVILASFVTGIVAVTLGNNLGNTLARKTPFHLTWLGGVILIALAFVKLF